jgi:hypothetical protein
MLVVFSSIRFHQNNFSGSGIVTCTETGCNGNANMHMLSAFCCRRAKICEYIFACKGVRVTQWRVLVMMIEFINSFIIHSILITQKYMQYSAIADLQIFQFTVVHALGFFVFRYSSPSNGSPHRNFHLKSLQILHIIKVFSHLLNLHRSSSKTFKHSHILPDTSW